MLCAKFGRHLPGCSEIRNIIQTNLSLQERVQRREIYIKHRANVLKEMMVGIVSMSENYETPRGNMM